MQNSKSPQPLSEESLARIRRKMREGYEQAKSDPDLQAMVANLNRNALKSEQERLAAQNRPPAPLPPTT